MKLNYALLAFAAVLTLGTTTARAADEPAAAPADAPAATAPAATTDAAPAAATTETPPYTLTIKDHKFTPDTLEIPAGQQVTITVINQDATAEEFESHDLDREKVIAANSQGIVLVGPLNAGTYNFAGEYNEDTAKGQIVVK